MADLAEGARLRRPGLGAVALGVHIPYQQEGRAEVEEAPEDQADRNGALDLSYTPGERATDARLSDFVTELRARVAR